MPDISRLVKGGDARIVRRQLTPDDLEIVPAHVSQGGGIKNCGLAAVISGLTPALVPRMQLSKDGRSVTVTLFEETGAPTNWSRPFLSGRRKGMLQYVFDAPMAPVEVHVDSSLFFTGDNPTYLNGGSKWGAPILEKAIVQLYGKGYRGTEFRHPGEVIRTLTGQSVRLLGPAPTRWWNALLGDVFAPLARAYLSDAKAEGSLVTVSTKRRTDQLKPRHCYTVRGLEEGGATVALRDPHPDVGDLRMPFDDWSDEIDQVVVGGAPAGRRGYAR